MTTQFVTMTPSLAKTILNASPQLARQVSQYRVEILAHRMQHPDPEDTALTWRVTIDRNGHLAAGRHELLAVVQANVGVRMTLEDDSDPNPFVNYTTPATS